LWSTFSTPQVCRHSGTIVSGNAGDNEEIGGQAFADLRPDVFRRVRYDPKIVRMGDSRGFQGGKEKVRVAVPDEGSGGAFPRFLQFSAGGQDGDGRTGKNVHFPLADGGQGGYVARLEERPAGNQGIPEFRVFPFPGDVMPGGNRCLEADAVFPYRFGQLHLDDRVKRIGELRSGHDLDAIGLRRFPRPGIAGIYGTDDPVGTLCLLSGPADGVSIHRGSMKGRDVPVRDHVPGKNFPCRVRQQDDTFPRLAGEPQHGCESLFEGHVHYGDVPPGLRISGGHHSNRDTGRREIEKGQLKAFGTLFDPI
jgi:hypothetical protein